MEIIVLALLDLGSEVAVGSSLFGVAILEQPVSSLLQRIDLVGEFAVWLLRVKLSLFANPPLIRSLVGLSFCRGTAKSTT
ncbi:MAG: hypothetical protein ACXVBO_08615 [Isosphaeraceae bacterium]